MKVSFGMLNKSVDENILQIKPDVFECDTDWFENTCPSIKETHLFLPDWEDAEDLEWVTMYFIAEKYDELLQNNDNVLCRDAKLFFFGEDIVNDNGQILLSELIDYYVEENGFMIDNTDTSNEN